MNGRNPYYTDQQMQQVPPYVNQNQQQPYFSNSNQYNNPPPPNYPPPQNYPQPHHPQHEASPNILVVGVPQDHSSSTLTPCKFCHLNTGTYAQLKSGVFVWMMCFIIMLLTCCCWWIAFWIDDWKDVIFRCDRCRNIKAIKEGGC